MNEVKKTFADLRNINVSENLEKKGRFNYLSWPYAVDTLLQNDPTATWEFSEPKNIGKTVMVFCAVTAFGKTMKMHLPVMDNHNNALENPNARDISDAMMRCLVKCIALFGIGLYIYAGEDIPQDAGPKKEKNDTSQSSQTAKQDTKKIGFGSRPQLVTKQTTTQPELERN